MEALRLVLRYAHLVGFAVLLGGAVTQYLSGRLRINQAMLWGSGAQLVTGLALAAPIRGDDDPAPNPVKLVVKLLFAIAIFVMVFFSRKRAVTDRGHFLAIIGLTLVNAAVATFWR